MHQKYSVIFQTPLQRNEITKDSATVRGLRNIHKEFSNVSKFGVIIAVKHAVRIFVFTKLGKAQSWCT